MNNRKSKKRDPNFSLFPVDFKSSNTQNTPNKETKLTETKKTTNKENALIDKTSTEAEAKILDKTTSIEADTKIDKTNSNDADAKVFTEAKHRLINNNQATSLQNNSLMKTNSPITSEIIKQLLQKLESIDKNQSANKTEYELSQRLFAFSVAVSALISYAKLLPEKDQSIITVPIFNLMKAAKSYERFFVCLKALAYIGNELPDSLLSEIINDIRMKETPEKLREGAYRCSHNAYKVDIEKIADK